MNAIDRKKAIREFKERKTARGIYPVRCAALAGTRRASRRRAPGGLERARQQAFTYEIVERLSDDESPLTLHNTLKEKRHYWLAQLGAQAL
jgi:hypothetical protein